jgi:Fe-S cluster assembly iron-binding protein IscA
MLTASKEAVQLLTNVRDSTDASDDAVLRVAAGAPNMDGSGPTVSLGFVDQPAADDEVGDAHGLPICVAPELSSHLDDALLDVVEEEGEARLVLVPSPEAT